MTTSISQKPKHSRFRLFESLGLQVHARLLARYDQMNALERLRDEAGRTEKCPCVWVLVPQDAQTDLPTLDGKEISLISPCQRARVPEPWLENIHRGERVQA